MVSSARVTKGSRRLANLQSAGQSRDFQVDATSPLPQVVALKLLAAFLFLRQKMFPVSFLQVFCQNFVRALPSPCAAKPGKPIFQAADSLDYQVDSTESIS